MKIPLNAHITWRREFVNCGKTRCNRCSATPFIGHGPYWYAYATIGRKFGKCYVGLNRAEWERKRTTTSIGPTQDIMRMLSRSATPLLASRILGIQPGVSAGRLRAAWKRKIRDYHPDVGGTNDEAAAVNLAYAMLKRLV